MNTNVIHTADSMDKLDELDAESVHAVVTDPPYGLAFMGRDWDDFQPKEYQEWCEKWARKVKRVLKPGGHLLAFSGNRTHHRAFAGVEDAGFEIRDTITWHYGSGFPKASDVSKTIDKRADAEREVVGEYIDPDGIRRDKSTERTSPNQYGEVESERHKDITAPATDAAKKWDGFKTALKPATEYVVMARKPFDGATVDCVLEHGTGALNVDGTRVGPGTDTRRPTGDQSETQDKYGHMDGGITAGDETSGRYPSNVVFDAQQADELDREVGETVTGDEVTQGASDRFWELSENGEGPSYTDSGGPSRYFYTSKASKAERTLDGKIENAHPTVKPGDLMEWLVKLVTREGQIVLDPFCGSGTTCKAAKDLGREFVGIERQPKHADLARVRVGLTPKDPSVVRSDDGQEGLEQYE